MYVRMSRAKCKPTRTAEVKVMIDRLKDRVDEAPGVQHWISVLTADGELVVASFFWDKRALEDSAHVNEKRWADAADLLQGPPDISQGEVLAFVST
jgi:hypothetical protein